MKQTGLPGDGLVVFVKAGCETCVMVQPVLRALDRQLPDLTVISQDDPDFPAGLRSLDDRSLELSFRHDIEVVPTVIRFRDGQEVARTYGWHRADWEELTGQQSLAPDLPDQRPGCGSRSRDPGAWEILMERYGDSNIAARPVPLGDWDDDAEACYDRGWTDGLPVVPPTDSRIIRMLGGTSRKPDEILGEVPPNLTPITVEKVAINAVMAGARPEYMPVILAALDAALQPEATMHGVLCTTCFSSPILVVNGPITRKIGMNSGINCLGQGNRANATIGRALQLIIRNVGGGRPGELDRAVLGGPGKFTFCFAENEHPGATDPVPRPVADGRWQLEALRVHQRHAGAGARTLCDLPQRRMGSRPHHNRPARCPAATGQRCCSGCPWHRRRRQPRQTGRHGRQILAGRIADCACWRTGGIVLRHLRRLDGRPVPPRVKNCNTGDKTMAVTLRDPTGEATSLLRDRTSPLAGFDGKTLALMDIGKMRGDEFIDRLEQLCTERGVATRRFKKPTNTRVAPPEMIDEIARTCDAVVVALSD